MNRSKQFREDIYVLQSSKFACTSSQRLCGHSILALGTPRIFKNVAIGYVNTPKNFFSLKICHRCPRSQRLLGHREYHRENTNPFLSVHLVWFFD